METLGGFPNPRLLPALHHPARFARPRAMVRADEGEGRRPEGAAGWEEGPESSAAPDAPGRGTASRGAGRLVGRGIDSRGAGRSPGRGIDSRAAGRSLGRGTSSRAIGRSSEEGRAGGLTRKVVLQNKHTWSMPPGGMSTTTCCPLKHFGQMTLSEATAMPFESFYHCWAFIA